ncbi:hypothetical protein [Chryseobacterium sp. JUb7]|uniref:hypothetical protein n=1 Tax=Chryseobacterium sp. JUb7 TaxID=2940599 RepID=UPI002167E27B|nr:hypothetical protein [Chryseobacterium sp. JUb7]MCS3529893.1 hypothetical protein [Chryseobacterium sp. JUb7]
MIKKYIPIIIFLVIIIVYYFSTGDNLQKTANENFLEFNESNLHEEVKDVDYYAKGIKIIFSDKQYVFYPITSDLNNNSIFLSTAEKGDSIIKKPYGDTLLLKKKNGAILKYTFRKFP